MKFVLDKCAKICFKVARFIEKYIEDTMEMEIKELGSMKKMP
jgi:hypothetical protein